MKDFDITLHLTQRVRVENDDSVGIAQDAVKMKQLRAYLERHGWQITDEFSRVYDQGEWRLVAHRGLKGALKGAPR